MLEQYTPAFPQGSVIVKERLSDQKSETPELMTVMIKQKKGFDPAGGDWEYMVTDGTGTRIEGRGKLANCQVCHIARPENDYIFRSYLDPETYKKLN